MSNNLDLDQVAENQSAKETTINNALGQLDAAITESFAVDLSGGNVTVNAANYERHLAFVCSGAATTGRTVTLPAQKKLSFIDNTSTTNSIAIVIGSTSLTLNPSSAALAYSDGTTNGLIFVGGNLPAIHELTDVNITSIADKQFLRYDAATSKWLNWNWGVSSKTVDYQFALGDASSTVVFNKSTAIIGTVPPNATVAFPIGTLIEVGQTGAGILTIAAGAGVTIRSVGGTLDFTDQYQHGQLRKVATDTWNLVIWGVGSGSGGSLSTLSDVDITSPTDGQALIYDAGSGTWKNMTGGGSDARILQGSGAPTVAHAKPAIYLDTASEGVYVSDWTIGVIPTIVQVKSASTSTLTMSTAPTDGNFLIAFVSHFNGTPTVGSGWTQIVNTSGASEGTSAYYKLCASESTSQAPTTGFGAGSGGCQTIVEVSGLDPTWANNFQVTGQTNSDVSGTLTGTLTPNRNTIRAFVFLSAAGSSPAAPSTPSGWTLIPSSDVLDTGHAWFVATKTQDMISDGALAFTSTTPTGGPISNYLELLINGIDPTTGSWERLVPLPDGGATGQVLTKQSSTDFDIDWEPGSGGGGGELYELGAYKAPLASYFDATSQFHSGLTLTSSDVADQGFAFLALGGTGHDQFAFWRRSTSGWGSTWAVTARIVGNALSGSFPGVGLAATDGTKLVGCILQSGGGVGSILVPVHRPDVNTFGANINSLAWVINPTWFRIRLASGNLFYGVSTDGINWFEKSESATAYLATAPTFVGIGGTADGDFGACAGLCTYYSDPDHP